MLFSIVRHTTATASSVPFLEFQTTLSNTAKVFEMGILANGGGATGTLGLGRSGAIGLMTAPVAGEKEDPSEPG